MNNYVIKIVDIKKHSLKFQYFILILRFVFIIVKVKLRYTFSPFYTNQGAFIIIMQFLNVSNFSMTKQ